MNSISEYFGSGHRSSAHEALQAVGDVAHVVHRGDHRVAHVGRPLRRRGVRLVVREVGVLELQQRVVQLLDERLQLADQLFQAAWPSVR